MVDVTLLVSVVLCVGLGCPGVVQTPAARASATRRLSGGSAHHLEEAQNTAGILLAGLLITILVRLLVTLLITHASLPPVAEWIASVENVVVD